MSPSVSTNQSNDCLLDLHHHVRPVAADDCRPLLRMKLLLCIRHCRQCTFVEKQYLFKTSLNANGDVFMLISSAPPMNE